MHAALGSDGGVLLVLILWIFFCNIKLSFVLTAIVVVWNIASTSVSCNILGKRVSRCDA